jgi:hypothetical protein
MRIFKQKIISLLVLLSLWAVILGPLWIGQAEARLGIEICTAQGIKIIPAPASMSGGITADSTNGTPSKPKHERIAPCLICAQNNPDCLVPATQSSAFLYLINDIQPQITTIHAVPNTSPVATTLQPRAPPISIL